MEWARSVRFWGNCNPCEEKHKCKGLGAGIHVQGTRKNIYVHVCSSSSPPGFPRERDSVGKDLQDYFPNSLKSGMEWNYDSRGTREKPLCATHALWHSGFILEKNPSWEGLTAGRQVGKGFQWSQRGRQGPISIWGLILCAVAGTGRFQTVEWHILTGLWRITGCRLENGLQKDTGKTASQEAFVLLQRKDDKASMAGVEEETHLEYGWNVELGLVMGSVWSQVREDKRKLWI